MIKVFQPKATAVLFKTVERNQGGFSERFTGATNRINLTPYIGDGGLIRTSKSIREPAGVFTIVCVDRVSDDPKLRDSLYGIIEAMDYVEIRMAREPHLYNGELPLVMRGFVSTIRRTEVMNSDGKPVRAVVISGQDYGKIFQQVQIFYQLAYLLGQIVTSTFRAFVVYGLPESALPASQFVRDVVDRMVNPYLVDLSTKTDSAGGGLSPEQPFNIQVDASVLKGTVAPYGFSPFEGNIWNFLETWSDANKWNELFVEDRPDGVYLVYRPMPYKDVVSGNNQYVQLAEGAKDPNADDPLGMVIDINQVESMDVQRGDKDVANFYWVTAPRSNTSSAPLLKADSILKGTIFLEDYQNSDPDLYGLKKMEVQSNQGGDGITTRADGVSKEQLNINRKFDEDWYTNRRRILVEQNRDNVVYEDGTFRLRGSEHFKPGRYLTLNRGSMRAEYYVTQIDQDFIPFNSFKTTATFERGTGFIERVKIRDSPYFREGFKGVYDE